MGVASAGIAEMAFSDVSGIGDASDRLKGEGGDPIRSVRGEKGPTICPVPNQAYLALFA